MSATTSPQRTYDDREILMMVGAVVTVVLVLWTLAAGASLLYDGSLPPLIQSVAGSIRIVSHHHWHNPAAAFDIALQRHMPAGPIWWFGAAMSASTVVAVAVGIWRRVDARRSQATLGRRPYELRGTRPRSWARPRDLRDLVVPRPQPNRFTLGRLDHRLIATDDEAHIAVIAPTRSGKTTRCVIPWLLEHEGPAIVTSTKTDILRATRADRARLEGQVWVWDPFGSNSAHWSPLSGCEDWSFAIRQAQWLGDASKDGNSEIATFWRREGGGLLAPLLHAAALRKDTITKVLSWIDSRDIKQAVATLRQAGNAAAIDQLSGVVKLDPRNRGTIYMSAAAVLSAYRLPQAAASAREGLTPAAFLDGKPNTLYVVASTREQRSLAPLAVALLSAIVHTAMEQADRSRPLEPTLRILLDEAASIAPLHDLPLHIAQAAGHGLRFATFWQSLAQLDERYEEGANDILANSTSKLLMGPITDATTRSYVLSLLGEDRDLQAVGSRETAAAWRAQPKGTAAELQQLQRGRALVIEGTYPPAILELRPTPVRRLPQTRRDHPTTRARFIPRTGVWPNRPGDRPESR